MMVNAIIIGLRLLKSLRLISWQLVVVYSFFCDGGVHSNTCFQICDNYEASDCFTFRFVQKLSHEEAPYLCGRNVDKFHFDSLHGPNPENNISTKI